MMNPCKLYNEEIKDEENNNIEKQHEFGNNNKGEIRSVGA